MNVSLIKVTPEYAKNVWMLSSGLHTYLPFGTGDSAALQAIKQLGYVQIDTIHVIERAHHHILWSRIPDYKPQILQRLQSEHKSVFEYWTHALSYIPADDFSYFMGRMSNYSQKKSSWFESVTSSDMKRIIKRIQENGPLSIQDVKDDVLVEKDHEWASKKPSKRVLEYLFFCGQVVISERHGMLKKYELTNRHFGWDKQPNVVSEKEYARYVLNRALKSQGIVSLDSTVFLDKKLKPLIAEEIEKSLRNKILTEVEIKGLSEKHWMLAEKVNNDVVFDDQLIHILSPFDPLVIQRKRLKALFDYEHKFEAYLPAEKRVFGYFALPIFCGNKVVAILDIKTDRTNKKLMLQQWTWCKKFRSTILKQKIEEKLNVFESFQLAKLPNR